MKKIPFLSLILTAFLWGGQYATAEAQKLVSFVDPFIGTGFHGHTYPGAAFPFGQIQLSPDNGTQGWDWCSGYHYSDSIISGFSHLHLSGTGIGDLADISIMPVTGKVSLIGYTKNEDLVASYASKFSHASEIATPGYYAVTLRRGNIRSEFTVSERAGFHRYSFPSGEQNNLILNLGFAINWDKPYETELRQLNQNTFVGKRLSKGWAADQHVFFAVQFSEPITSSSISEVGGKGKTVGVFNFKGASILVKVGISSVSTNNALANLKASIPDWNFDAVKDRASKAWEKELSGITITGTDPVQKKIFYTSLYHTMVAPALFSDLNGEYKGMKGDVQKANGYKRYTVFSLWDTYRALHPLFTILQPSKVNDMIKTMLDYYRQTGILPVWELEGNETFCMVGNHSIAVIAEAIMKDLGNFDRELAFEAMKATSLKDRDGMGLWDKLGYMPADKVQQSVAKSLEVAIDDWCVAAVAKKMGKMDDAAYFTKRAMNYKNYFDRETGFMRGKLSNGKWTSPFDPLYSQHEGSDYTEGNGWQYLWLVPQDVDGLIKLLGGTDLFVKKLDQLFNQKQGVVGGNASPDISGLIGAYAHGNEPGHHTTFLFNYAGAPWRTQELNRQIQSTMYTDKVDGICGNEDCGQMSAWYVFSAMGLYPVNPCDLKYQFGSPLIPNSRIKVGKDKYFTIIAHDASLQNKYIQKVVLNGKELKRTYITHQELMNGGTLEFTMGGTICKMAFN